MDLLIFFFDTNKDKVEIKWIFWIFLKSKTFDNLNIFLVRKLLKFSNFFVETEL